MMQQLRHRSRTSRIFWIALLLWALVWQPGLIVASEVHESEHLLQTGHALDATHGEHGIPADEPMPPDGADPWHALMHLGHCCSYPSAMLPDMPQMAFGPDIASPPAGGTFDADSAPQPQPLRPPITG